VGTAKARQFVDAMLYTNTAGPMTVRMYRRKCSSEECGHVVYSTFSTNGGSSMYYYGEAEKLLAVSTQTVFTVELLQAFEYEAYYNATTFTGFCAAYNARWKTWLVEEGRTAWLAHMNEGGGRWLVHKRLAEAYFRWMPYMMIRRMGVVRGQAHAPCECALTVRVLRMHLCIPWRA
jgi:hypothetical protein